MSQNNSSNTTNNKFLSILAKEIPKKFVPPVLILCVIMIGGFIVASNVAKKSPTYALVITLVDIGVFGVIFAILIAWMVIEDEFTNEQRVKIKIKALSNRTERYKQLFNNYKLKYELYVPKYNNLCQSYKRIYQKLIQHLKRR